MPFISNPVTQVWAPDRSFINSEVHAQSDILAEAFWQTESALQLDPWGLQFETRQAEQLGV